MAAEINFDPELNFIEVTLTGTMALSDMKATRQSLKVLSEKEKIVRILVNAFELEALPGTTSLYEFASTFWAVGFSKEIRFGVVASAETGDDFQFMENVAQNRAFMFRQFTDRNEAIQWLMG